MMIDKYDKAVEELKKVPSIEICLSWNRPRSESPESLGGCLFDYVSPDGSYHDSVPWDPSERCGCLTEIASGKAVAWTEDLTVRIKADNRIPLTGMDIEHKDLRVFAEWQRIIHKELEGMEV